MINLISDNQWMKTDNAKLKNLLYSLIIFLQLVAKLSILCIHYFFTEAQKKYFN